MYLLREQRAVSRKAGDVFIENPVGPVQGRTQKPVFRRNRDTGREFQSMSIDSGIDSRQDVARSDIPDGPSKQVAVSPN